MSRLYILLFLLALGHDCQAAKQIDSPNGAWTLKRTPLKTLTGDPTEGIGVFPAAGGEPVTIPVKTLNYVTGVTIRWSPDSRTVALAERFARTALITASWLDGQTWHSTIQEDRDLDPLLAKAEELGSKRRGYKTETAEIGSWISADTIEVHGVLGYVGYPNLSYSYHMRIVPGSYPVSGVLSGGYEVGALKYSDYHVEALPATDPSKPAPSTQYIFGQPCTLTGQLKRGPQGAWALQLNEVLAVGSNNPGDRNVSGVSEVILIGMSPKAVAYLATITGKTIKVSGSLKAPTPASGDENVVEFVLSDEIVKALERRLGQRDALHFHFRWRNVALLARATRKQCEDE